MSKISACIIVKNEEKFIKNCLESIKDIVDEIIIVDDCSNDKTVEICKKYTDKIYENKLVNFAQQRNFAITKTTGDWIFFIDADECISSILQKELRNLVKEQDYCCFAFSRKTYIKNDYWIKHGRFYPDYQARLFRKNCLLGFKNVIHEIPLYNGEKKKIKLDLIHHQEDKNTVFNPEIYKEYVIYELKKIKREKSRFFYMVKAFSAIIYNFFKIYFYYKGFKDNYVGLIESWRWAKYRFLVYIGLALK
jgi:glycosyltransferase involved in cell wall biosynthesis